ncbi:hypothetical protein DBR32_05625 [Taibaiella sp. KBW10]|nr:hypothetical protein DBR32_05625 [Taibaiella sp. KBW10]
MVLCIIIAIVASVLNLKILLVLATLLSVSLLWGYYKLGTVYLALGKLRRNQLEEAETIINLNTKPERLMKNRRAYFYYIKAYLAREKDDFSTAKNLFELALDEGLRVEQDKAIALLSLADIAVIKGEKEVARSYLQRMKGLKVQPQLMPQIQQMQQYLA